MTVYFRGIREQTPYWEGLNASDLRSKMLITNVKEIYISHKRMLEQHCY